MMNYIPTFLLFLTAIASWAQVSNDTLLPIPIYGIHDLINKIDGNPQLMAMDEKIKSYDAYAQAARSWPAPKVSAGLWMYPYKKEQPMVLDHQAPAEPDKGAFMVGIEQMIPNISMLKAEQKFMAGMSSVDAAMKNWEKEEMKLMIKMNYYDWLTMKKKLKVLKQSEAVLQLMISSGEISYTYNQIPLSRIYKAKSELFNLQNMQIMLESDVQKMRIEMNTLLHWDKNFMYDIDTAYSFKELTSYSPQDTLILDNRSDVRNIEASLENLRLRKDLEKSKRKPEFGIEYAHMNSFGNMPNQFNLMGMVILPIVPWADKAYKSNMKGIAFEEASLKKKREALISESSGRIRKTMAELENKKRQWEMYHKNIIPALEKNFHTSLIAFEHMQEDLFMTLDAWMALKMAKVESTDLLGDILKLQATYEREIEK